MVIAFDIFDISTFTHIQQQQKINVNFVSKAHRSQIQLHFKKANKKLLLLLLDDLYFVSRQFSSPFVFDLLVQLITDSKRFYYIITSIYFIHFKQFNNCFSISN